MIPISIKTIQSALKIPETGIYDDFTEAAVRNFQLRNSLVPTGIVDNDTASILFPLTESSEEIIPMPDVTPSTDLSEVVVPIKQYRLKRGQYLNGPTKKEYVFLHHTAGWENPYLVVDQWGSDSRGPVGTQFVIGGRNCQTLSDKYDGEILQCLDYENYAWHIGLGNIPIHTNSIAIELCNFGYVTQVSKGQYKTYIGKSIQKSEVTDLGAEWRGQRFFHKYTDAQLKSLDFLIRKIGQEQGIDIRAGLRDRLIKMGKFEAFNYGPSISSGKVHGLFTHANVSGPNKWGRYEKWDLFPQDEICDLIMAL